MVGHIASCVPKAIPPINDSIISIVSFANKGVPAKKIAVKSVPRVNTLEEALFHHQTRDIHRQNTFKSKS